MNALIKALLSSIVLAFTLYAPTYCMEAGVDSTEETGLGVDALLQSLFREIEEKIIDLKAPFCESCKSEIMELYARLDGGESKAVILDDLKNLIHATNVLLLAHNRKTESLIPGQDLEPDPNSPKELNRTRYERRHDRRGRGRL